MAMPPMPLPVQCTGANLSRLVNESRDPQSFRSTPVLRHYFRRIGLKSPHLASSFYTLPIPNRLTVGALYEPALLLESTNYARSQTAPAVKSRGSFVQSP